MSARSLRSHSSRASELAGRARTSGPASVLLAAGLLAALAAPAPASAQEAGEIDMARVAHVADSVAHHAIATDQTPGLTVAVARDGELLFARGYGVADAELGVAAGPETVYRIGSVTKQFTAAAVMRLVEAGERSLEDPITDYLPDYPTHGHTVTIRQLLNHTSGIPSYTGLGDAFWSKARLDLTEAELVDLFDELDFDFEPGVDYRYNNSAYYLLGVIIGKVTGTPFARHIEEMTASLGLDHTFYCDNTRIIEDRAEGYAYRDGELANAEYISMANPGAAGAMCSTVGDLVRWTERLHDDEVVSPSSLEAMTTPTALSSGDTAAYGFGLGLGELEGHRKVHHAGGINGFTSYVARYPAESLTTVVLTNSGSANPGQIEDAIARTALGIPLEVIADLPLSDEELHRFTGRFVLQTGEDELPIRFYAEDGRLYAHAAEQSPNRLMYQGDGVFIPDFSNDVRIVFEGEGERAPRVTLHQGGGVYRGERVDGTSVLQPSAGGTHPTH